jgi:acetyltransferase
LNIHNLDRILNPQRIALIGITGNPNSVSGKILKNLVDGGFGGVIYPVNPAREAVLGIPCYPDVASLPRTPDLAVVCTPAEEVPGIVTECGKAGILGMIVNSAGFGESNAAGKTLEEQVLREAAKFEGMRILGPNCLGVIVPHLNLNASFASHMPQRGHIAFVSQSGALCTSVLDWAMEENIGFSYFISIGNTIDVDFADLIDYLGADEKTESIILYIESIKNARKFMTAARAFARSKPILAYKAGRFQESAAVAASHTGALAGEDAIYDAAFQRAGIARVLDFGEIFDCAELIARHKMIKGSRLGIVTNAGGPGVIATDALVAANGRLAELSQDTLKKLNENLPPSWSGNNPVDILGDARSRRFVKATEIMVTDPGVDAVLIIITPQAMTNVSTIAKKIAELAKTTSKQILVTLMGGLSMTEATQILNQSKIPTYTTPEQAVRAFMTLVSYSKNLGSLYETPRDIPVEFSLDRIEMRNRFDQLTANEGDVLSEVISKKIIASYGITTTPTEIATSREMAVDIAQKMGFPVVLKIFSPDITHKSDVKGVQLNLHDHQAVQSAFDRIFENARHFRPEARLEGVTVQPMVNNKDGIELILGIKKDPIFGTVIMVGSGGIAAELLGDRAIGLPPLNERLALRKLESLKIWPLLTGYRGQPPLNTEKLIEVLIRISYLAADYPEIKELDINPLLITRENVIALDTRIVIDREMAGKAVKPFSHLALRPYPEEFVKSATLNDGTPLLLRPIKPEDEPMWFDLLRSCSRESIYARFRYFFHWETHEVASRYCFNDYDREIAIVAEIQLDGEQQLLGVGRLVADPNHETAEYAVLISDNWQQKGLGSLLTDYCMGIAKSWEIKRVVAQTTTDNQRMIAVFQKRNFDIIPDVTGSMVEVAKDLA